MERLSRKQKYQEYRDELKKDNEAFAKSQALNDYQNKIDQLQSQFEGGQTVNEAPVQKEIPPQEPVQNVEDTKEEVDVADFSKEYKDLFDLLDDTPVVEETPVEPSFVEPEPVPTPEPVYEEPVVEPEPIKVEEPIKEEPTVIEPVENEEPIVIDTTQDYFEEDNADVSELDNIVQGIDNYKEEIVETYIEPEIAEFDNVKPIEPVYEEPVVEPEPIYEEPVYEEPTVELEPEKVEEPVYEEPVVEPEPIKVEEPQIPVVEIEEEPEEEEPIKEEPVETTQQFEPIKEPDGIEIKNLDELVQEEEINATLTDTIPFVIDDEAVKEAIEEYDEEEDEEEDEEVPNKVLNVILIILIVVLVIVLGLIVYYILAGQGIIG